MPSKKTAKPKTPRKTVAAKKNSTKDEKRLKVDIENVREYLIELDKSVRPTHSIEALANSQNLDPKALRKFKDGDEAALPISTVTLMASVLGRDGDLIGAYFDPELNKLVDSGDRLIQAMIRKNSDDAKIRYIDRMERDRPEVRSAMDAWADMAIGGAVGVSVDEIPLFEPKVVSTTDRARRMQATLNGLHEQVSTRLLPWESKWMISRGMAQYGREWGEISLKQNSIGSFEVDEIVPRHVRTMRVNRQADGDLDFNEYYEQFDPGTGNAYTTFPFWKILHFKRSARWCQDEGEGVVEGVITTNIKMSALENAMLIRRVENSARERVFKHDISGLDEAGKKTYIESQKKGNKRLKTIDRNGQTDVLQIAQPTGTDHHIPVSGDSKNAVEVLPSDPNIDKIDDFKHFHATFRAGLGPPNAHLNYEGDTMRSVITDLHIVFARKVRRLQMNYIAEEKKLYDIMLILRGIDPRSQPYLILPPTLGTRDELIQAQIASTYAAVIRNLATAFSFTGKVPTIEWFLRTFMGLTDEQFETLELAPVVAPIKTDVDEPDKIGKGNNSKPNEVITGDDLRTGEQMRSAMFYASRAGESWTANGNECVRGLKFLLAERAIQRNRFDIAEQFCTEAKKTFHAILAPSSVVRNIDIVARQLGKTYLWSV